MPYGHHSVIPTVSLAHATPSSAAAAGFAAAGRSRVHSVLEKFLKMLEFRIKTLRPLKVLENR